MYWIILIFNFIIWGFNGFILIKSHYALKVYNKMSSAVGKYNYYKPKDAEEVSFSEVKTYDKLFWSFKCGYKDAVSIEVYRKIRAYI